MGKMTVEVRDPNSGGCQEIFWYEKDQVTMQRHFCADEFEALEEYFNDRNTRDGSHLQSAATGDEAGTTDASDPADPAPR